MAQMTKAEARGFLKRIREAVRDAEVAIRTGNGDALFEDIMEIGGCAGEIETALADSVLGTGIKGVRYDN
jgi:hypothetical protein